MTHYRPLTARTNAAAAGAAIGLAAIVIDTLVPGNPLDVLKDAHAPVQDAVNAWLVLLAEYVVEPATLLFWIYGAAKNVRALGRQELRFTPFTSVAWFFMPIANLWMIYRALSEIWRASVPSTSPTAWKDEDMPVKVLGWWVVTLCTIIGDDGPTALGWVGVVIAAVSAGWFVILAFELRDRQQQCFEKVSATVRPL